MTFVVTAHQPNFLPGASVVGKIAAADALIWMDACQYEKEGFTNRNRLPDGSWLTVPVQKHPTETAIQDVRLVEEGAWRHKLVNKIRNAYPHLQKDDMLFHLIRCENFTHLAPFNRTLTYHIWSKIGGCPPLIISQAVMRYRRDDVSLELAQMVAHLRGDVYLSGPSGKRYLNETPFRERGIDVVYWKHDGPNPSILERYAAWQLSSSAQ